MENTATAQTGLLSWWHRTPLYLRIVGGMVLGVVAGVLLGPYALPLAVPSKLVFRVLGALAPMLILLAIIQALMKAKFEKGTATRLLSLLLLNTVVAICIGLLVANVIKPGHYLPAGHHEMGEGAESDGVPEMLKQFLENVPQSLVGPLADNGRVMGVIFIAVAFGLALRGRATKPVGSVADFIDVALETLIVILHWVIEVVPLAVFGLVASIIGTKGFGAFHALGAFIIAVLVALLLQAAYYLVRVRIWTWVKPLDLLRGCRDALVMAFSTGSSTVTMPVTFQCLRERVGLREKSASLGALVGSNFNNDGTALYEAMAALFVAQMLAVQGLGLELTLGQQLTVVVTSVIASVGAAGIPEAGLVTMTLVFTAVKLPPEYIGLLLPVDWFLDRCRTAINVMGDMNVSCMLDGKTRESAAEADAAAQVAPAIRAPARRGRRACIGSRLYRL
ncbi:MAG TPA: dicarboxylate/amino acid:cation symporter [Chthoniobacteraceae bacterium]|jgi:DAACS family dicarboxylate/amino acid:cation (Na+ or H+) symporter|nr:dicarboxylate/amino acid:cation symporter [Chthoniobacteraceae bacterium]